MSASHSANLLLLFAAVPALALIALITAPHVDAGSDTASRYAKAVAQGRVEEQRCFQITSVAKDRQYASRMFLEDPAKQECYGWRSSSSTLPRSDDHVGLTPCHYTTPVYSVKDYEPYFKCKDKMCVATGEGSPKYWPDNFWKSAPYVSDELVDHDGMTAAVRVILKGLGWFRSTPSLHVIGGYCMGYLVPKSSSRAATVTAYCPCEFRE